MVDYSWPRVNYEKDVKILFFGGFLYRSRGARGLFQRVQNRSGSLKSTNYANFLKNYFFLDFFFDLGAQGALRGPRGGPKKEILTGYEILTGTQG